MITKIQMPDHASTHHAKDSVDARDGSTQRIFSRTALSAVLPISQGVGCDPLFVGHEDLSPAPSRQHSKWSPGAKFYGSAVSICRAALVGSTNVVGDSYLPATCIAAPAICHESEKSAEARRQIDRVLSLMDLCQENHGISEKCKESVASAVSLIRAFLTSPIPIPVAAAGENNQASLFISDGDFYGDLEISGDNIEYYIKFNFNGENIEYFNSEKIEGGFIPPKLLGKLYHYYAQN